MTEIPAPGPTHSRQLRAKLVRWAVLISVLVLVNVVTPSYLQGELTRVWALAIVAMSLDLLLGYAGLFSLGHAAFLGAGGYAAAMLTVRFGIRDFWVAVIAASVTALVVGALFGLLALRVRGAYFLLITFALAQLLFVLATVWDFLSPHGFGSVGITAIRMPTVAPFGWRLSATGLYFVTAAVMIGAYLLLRRFLASPLGMALQGSRENESRMNALGYRPATAQYAAFVIAAAIAGFAGALLVFHDGIATPNLLGVDTSTLVVLMVLIGGARTLTGSIAGAAVIVLAEYVISGYLPQRWPLILGAIFVAAVMLARGGLLPALRPLATRMLRRGLVRLRVGAAAPSMPPVAPADRVAVSAQRVDAATEPSVGDTVVLRAENLVKHFRGVQAVDGVSIDVHEGERLAIIGTNGAGKSTMFNLLGGSLIADSGRIELRGRDISTMAVRERARLGMARSFQINSLFGELTVEDNLWLAAAAHESWRRDPWRPMHCHADVGALVTSMLGQWDLTAQRGTPVTALPYGDQRRLEIAMAFAARPDIVLLDEPTAGLSQAESAEFGERLHRVGRGVTVLLIAHDPQLVFSVADRVAVMHQGRLVATGTSDEIRRNDLVRQLYMPPATNSTIGGQP